MFYFRKKSGFSRLYLSQRTRKPQTMSRPPTMQVPQENPYNGGLIDFHESVLKADLGSALYAQQLAAQNQYQAQFQYQNGVSLPNTPVVQQVGSSIPNPYMTHVQTGIPSHLQGQQHMQSMMMAQAPAQCIAGPPAFLHLHGKVYAPVEESGTAAPAAPEPQARVAAKEPSPQQSAKSFDRMVEKRIEQKVNEFVSKNIKPQAKEKGMRKKNGAGQEDFGLKDLNSAMRSRIRGY